MQPTLYFLNLYEYFGEICFILCWTVASIWCSKVCAVFFWTTLYIILLLVLWYCWFGARKSKLSDEVVVRSKVHIVCLWSSWCHCHPQTPSSFATFKSRLILPFWYQFTKILQEKRLLNGCSSLIVIIIALWSHPVRLLCVSFWGKFAFNLGCSRSWLTIFGVQIYRAVMLLRLRWFSVKLWICMHFWRGLCRHLLTYFRVRPPVYLRPHSLRRPGRLAGRPIVS